MINLLCGSFNACRLVEGRGLALLGESMFVAVEMDMAQSDEFHDVFDKMFESLRAEFHEKVLYQEHCLHAAYLIDIVPNMKSVPFDPTYPNLAKHLAEILSVNYKVIGLTLNGVHAELPKETKCPF